MRSSPSELLLRWLDRLRDRRVLLLNWPADDAADLIQQTAHSLQLFVTDFRLYEACQRQKVTVQFGSTPAYPKPFDVVILHAGKEKALSRYLAATSGELLGDGSELWLVGENRAGAKSAGKWLNDYFDSTVKADSARRCSLFIARQFRADKQSWHHAKRLAVAGENIDLVWLPGVFSAKELDPASRLLLENLPQTEADHALDYGCGCGVLGAFLLRAGRATAVDFVDINAMALASSSLTLAANQLSGRLIAGSSLAAAARGYDLIVSNPPFHRGVETNYDDTIRFLTASKDHLRRDGQLVVVANAFLPYRTVLEKHFNQVDVLADDRRFRVYRAQH